MTTRVEITVTPRRQPGRDRAKKKGSLKPSRSRDDLGRRRVSSGLINFYDLGYLKNTITGSFETIPFVHKESGSLLFGAGMTVDLTNAELEAGRDNSFLSVPADQWKTRFKHIGPTEGERYGLAISNGSELIALNASESLFSENGFQAPNGFLGAGELTVGAPFAFEEPFSGVAFKGAFRNRVTNTYNSNAQDIGPVDFRGTVDVFLAPRPIFNYFSGLVGNIAPAPARFYMLNYFYTIVPREKWLDPAHPLFGMQIFSNLFFQNPTMGLPGDLVAYNQIVTYLDFLKGLPQARMLFALEGDSAWGSGSIGMLPQAEMTPPQTGIAIGLMGYNMHGSGTSEFVFPTKPLVAVVVKGNSRFYVWGDTV